jgi:hypothetical protein
MRSVRKASEIVRVDKLRRVSASVGLGNKSSGGTLIRSQGILKEEKSTVKIHRGN